MKNFTWQIFIFINLFATLLSILDIISLNIDESPRFRYIVKLKISPIIPAILDVVNKAIIIPSDFN